MKKNYPYIVLGILCGIISIKTFAQLTVGANPTNAALANALVGPGATITNLTVSCPNGAYGTFNGASSNIGIASGVLLTTGSVNSALGPDNSESAGVGWGTTTNDPDIIGIEPDAIFDPCVLEFDIVPTCNMLQMQYVFASEEYDEYVCAGVNDAFGFFINGVTTALPKTNIALVPGTSLPVSINTINNGSPGTYGSNAQCDPGGLANSAYYNVNTQNSHQYDGFTDVLMAQIPVVACETYHMKLIIADGGDAVYDSGVFLTYQGITCPGPTPTLSPDVTICAGQSTTLTAGGGASSYNWAPATGLNTTTGTTVIATPTITTTYTVSYGGTGCGATVQTENVTVTVNNPVANAGTDQTICNAGSAQLNATGGGTYAWSPATGLSATNIANPTASPATNTTYTVTVTDANGCSDTDDVIINVSGITVDAGTDATICNGSSTTLNASGTASTYVWSPVTGLSNPNILNPIATPTTTTTYTLTASSTGCTPVTDQVTITVITMVADAGVDQTICNAANAQLNGTGGGNYSWAPPGGLSATNIANPIANPTVNTTYTLTVTDANGCSDTDDISITVTSITVDAGTDAIICEGESTTLNASGTGTTYAWTPTTGLNNPNIANPIANPNSTTIYTVTASTPGCNPVTDQVTVTVNPLPIPGFTPTTVCLPNPTTFASTSTVSSGTITTYSWNFTNPTATSTSANPQHLFNNAGTFNVTLTVTTDAGCTASITTPVDAIIGATPDFTATEVCEGVATTFTDASTLPNGETITSIAWTFDGTNTGSGSPANYTFPSANTYNVTISVTLTNGCVTTTTKPVTVNPLPVASFTSTTVCENTATSFTNNSSISSGSITTNYWTFENPVANTSTNVNPQYQFPGPGTHEATLTVTSDKGCTATITNNVTVSSTPVISFSADDTEGCAVHCVGFLDNSTVAGGTISSWAWDFGDGNTSNAGVKPTHCYNTAGIYDVTLTVVSNNGCSATYTATQMITVYAVPNANFTSSDPVSILEPKVNFTNLSSSADTYTWNLGDGTFSNDFEPTHTYSYENAGTYTVTLVTETNNGCIDSITKTVVVTPEYAFFVPNTFTPLTNDATNMTFFGTGFGVAEQEMWIYDRWGNEIFHGSGLNVAWDGKVQGGPSGALAQIDTYVWVIRTVDVMGYRHRYVGHVNLIK